MAWLTLWMGIFAIIIVVGGVRIIYNEKVVKKNHYKDVDKIESNIDLITFMKEVITAFVIPIILAYITMGELRTNIAVLSIFLVYIIVSGFSLWQILKAERIENKLLAKMESTKNNKLSPKKTDSLNETLVIEENINSTKQIRRIIPFNVSDNNEIFITVEANFVPEELFISKGKLLFNPPYLSKVGDKKFVLKVNKLIEDLGYGDEKDSVRIAIKSFELSESEYCKYIQLRKENLSNGKNVWRVEEEEK